MCALVPVLVCRDIDRKLAESTAGHVTNINAASEAAVKAVSDVVSGAAGVFELRVNKRLGTAHWRQA